MTYCVEILPFQNRPHARAHYFLFPLGIHLFHSLCCSQRLPCTARLDFLGSLEVFLGLPQLQLQSLGLLQLSPYIIRPLPPSDPPNFKISSWDLSTKSNPSSTSYLNKPHTSHLSTFQPFNLSTFSLLLPHPSCLPLTAVDLGSLRRTNCSCNSSVNKGPTTGCASRNIFTTVRPNNVGNASTRI